MKDVGWENPFREFGTLVLAIVSACPHVALGFTTATSVRVVSSQNSGKPYVAEAALRTA